MSVPGSNNDKSAADKSPDRCQVQTGGHAAQQAGADDNVTVRADNKRRRELGGPAGPEPTRFGDWERKGRCIDF